jgi:phthalate 4,5-cis-dihydrodiol dehydrogenase
MADTLKVGIAGLGFGATEFIPTLERLEEIEIVAGADLRPQALEAFQERYGGRTYQRVEELCADPEVEAVWIATPNHLHAPNAITAAEHGKHILLRKPMGITMEECQRVLKAVEENGVKLLAGGQTQGTSPLIREARRIITSGELGPLRAMNVWAYTGWMLRPRMPQEVDESVGGGVVWRQAPHQIETLRYLGGGLVRSVRAMTGRWRQERPHGSGYYAAFLELDDGVPVTMVYNAYGFFDSIELTTWAEDRGLEGRVRSRRALLAGEMDEEEGKERTRFGSPGEGSVVGGAAGRPWTPGNLGVFVLSCQDGDIRMSEKGLRVYDRDGQHEVEVFQPGGQGMELGSEVLELYDAVKDGKPLFHDGRWGMATAEVQWALIESAQQRKEIMLSHQVPVPQGF